MDAEMILMLWGWVVAPLGTLAALVIGLRMQTRQAAPVSVPPLVDTTTAASRAAERIGDHSETVSLYEAMNLAAAGKV